MRGFSLGELLIVIAIMGIVTAVAIPVFSSTKNSRLEFVAQQVSDALIYARERSIHSQVPHAVIIDRANQKIEVRQVNTTTVPATLMDLATHPITKHAYRINIGQDPYSEGIKISNAADVFLLTNFTRTSSIFFDIVGTPLWKDGSGVHGLVLGQVDIDDTTSSKKVNVYPMTGRVLTQ